MSCLRRAGKRMYRLSFRRDPKGVAFARNAEDTGFVISNRIYPCAPRRIPTLRRAPLISLRVQCQPQRVEGSGFARYPKSRMESTTGIFLIRMFAKITGWINGSSESGVLDFRRDFSAFLRQTAEVDSYPDYFASGNRRNDSFDTIRTLVALRVRHGGISMTTRNNAYRI
jgi:hypothetical protein